MPMMIWTDFIFLASIGNKKAEVNHGQMSTDYIGFVDCIRFTLIKQSNIAILCDPA